LLHTDTKVSAVVLPWLFFGSSGHVDKPNELVLKAYTHRVEFDNFPPNTHVKSIVRPNKVKRCRNPHAFEVEGLTMGANGDEVNWQQKRDYWLIMPITQTGVSTITSQSHNKLG